MVRVVRGELSQGTNTGRLQFKWCVACLQRCLSTAAFARSFLFFFLFFFLIILKSFEWSHKMCVCGLFFFMHTLNILHLHRQCGFAISPHICMEIDELIPQKHFERQKSFGIYPQYTHTHMHTNTRTLSIQIEKHSTKMYSKYLRILFLVKCFDIMLDTTPRLEDMQVCLTSFTLAQQLRGRKGCERR